MSETNIIKCSRQLTLHPRQCLKSMSHWSWRPTGIRREQHAPPTAQPFYIIMPVILIWYIWFEYIPITRIRVCSLNIREADYLLVWTFSVQTQTRRVFYKPCCETLFRFQKRERGEKSVWRLPFLNRCDSVDLGARHRSHLSKSKFCPHTVGCTYPCPNLTPTAADVTQHCCVV